MSDVLNEVIAKEYREGISGYKIAKRHKISYMAVYRALERMGISRRNASEAHYKYSFNENAFDIMTAESAYWLGFIYADGTIDKKRPILRIILHKKDKIILEKFKQFLNATHPVLEFSNQRETACFQIVSKKLIGRLNLLGVYPQKTKEIMFPYFLPEKYYSDFIRGYFDGDGSLSTNGRNSHQVKFGITSHPEFLKQIQKILIKNCGLKKTKLYRYKGKTSASLSYGGNKQIKRILAYLIKNGGFYLPRKIGRWLPSQMSNI